MPDAPSDEVLGLKLQLERSEAQARYWMIEAKTDHARWLRALSDLDRLRRRLDGLREAGDDLWYALRHRSFSQDAIDDWIEARDAALKGDSEP